MTGVTGMARMTRMTRMIGLTGTTANVAPGGTTHRFRRRVAGWPKGTGALLLGVAGVLLFASAALAGDRVIIQMGTVRATNTGAYFDDQLASMRRQFQNLFHFTSYQLLKEENRSVGCGDLAGFDVPGGRYLQVVPKSVTNDRVSLNVRLLQESRLLINTDFTLRNRGTILVGGPRDQDGVLIIWIGARTE